MSGRKTQLPLLIDAFPIPPSHIPLAPSPSPSFNPPPSRPPPGPLPPVPGPSRISEADTLQILLLSSRSNRSRRSFKYSLASNDANRDSVLSTSSLGNFHPSPRPSHRLPSAGSNRSSTASSPSSPRSYTRPPFSLPPDDASRVSPAVLRDVVSPMLPLFDEDEEQSPKRRPRRHQANESISSINMRDILGATSAGEDDDVELLAAKKTDGARPLTSSHSRNSSLAYLMPEEPPAPLHLSTAPSMASSSTATLRSPLQDLPEEVQQQQSPPSLPNPTSAYVPTSTPRTPRKPVARAPSPDIDTIIQSTPKPPKLSTARSFSLTHEKGVKASAVRSVKSMRSFRLPVDEFGVMPNAMRLSKTTVGRGSSVTFDTDDSLNYIVDGVWNHGDDDAEERRVRELEKELEVSGSDSDSSLDLHTPLPHLMVRHGLLSPNSKLLPGQESRSNTPYDGRPGSTMSTFSTVSKSGVLKDERDTLTRRVRHRDGRLLRGGIGLTTGLGWSDSEDEDAPSPLTKRLSTLNLSQRSSTSSSSSSIQRAHPLSRSYSSGTLYDTYLDEEDEDEFPGNWSPRQTRVLPTSNPPTAWARKTSGARTSVASSGGRSSIASSGGRLSTGSAFSLEVSIPEHYEASLSTRRRGARESASSAESASFGHNGRSVDEARTPSSSSTLSIPLPVTPQHDPHVPAHVLKTLNGQQQKKQTYYLNKDKNLPPLPGVLRKTPSKTNSLAVVTPSTTKPSFPRARTFSSTSSSASSPSPALAQSTPTAAPANTHVRPLQLPRQMRAATSAGDRPAVPVPSILSRSTRKASLPLSSPSSPVPPSPTRSLSASASEKPRPRTGTGMVYKKSSGSSKLRPPMPPPTSSLGTSSSPLSLMSLPGGRPMRVVVKPVAI